MQTQEVEVIRATFETILSKSPLSPLRKKGWNFFHLKEEENREEKEEVFSQKDQWLREGMSEQENPR